MFQFSGLPLSTLYIQMEVIRHDSYWVAPFGYLRVSLLATNRSFSLLATPFIGSKCQGIHRAPFLTWLRLYRANRHILRCSFPSREVNYHLLLRVILQIKTQLQPKDRNQNPTQKETRRNWFLFSLCSFQGAQLNNSGKQYSPHVNGWCELTQSTLKTLKETPIQARINHSTW